MSDLKVIPHPKEHGKWKQEGYCVIQVFADGEPGFVNNFFAVKKDAEDRMGEIATAIGKHAISRLGVRIVNACLYFEVNEPLAGQADKDCSAERVVGYPCSFCGASSFDDAADKCRGFGDCPGACQSRQVFDNEPMAGPGDKAGFGQASGCDQNSEES